MTFTIPPASPKAAAAASFGRELVRAAQARGIPFSELERTVGIGHTTLDNYRRGLSLPKLEPARALAQALASPRLGEIVERARTATCARPGCGRRFRNDGGSPKRYCSLTCRRIAENLRLSERRARQAGQTDSAKRRHEQLARLRSAVRIADERAALLADAIAAMCRDCEPEGLCRQPECALRTFSPLPLTDRADAGDARPLGEIRSAAWTPERRARHSDVMRRHWASPGERERHGEASRAWHAALPDEERAALGRRISEGRRRGA